MKDFCADVAVIGGSVGGCAAALAAARMGRKVILTEETDWIGGQLTNQAVPPDEHPWVEQFGATRSYRNYRDRVRQYYKLHYPVTAKARADEHLNPGSGGVSKLCHEPRVSLAVLYEMLAPHLSSGRVEIWLRHKAEAAETSGDYVRSVTVRGPDGECKVVHAPYILDATDLGDLLPLSGAEYRVGAESQAETDEPHARPETGDPLNHQSITYCFAMDYFPGKDHTIPKPEQYGFWRDYKADFWPGKLLSWTACHPITLEPREHALFPNDQGKHSLWKYRQILDKDHFASGAFPSSITLVNWPQVDYWLGPIMEVSDQEVEKHLWGAKQLSLSWLYWMQTEAPRPDGGAGYPGLRLRPDVVGTDDGLAKYPYVRESRRMRTEFTVLEQHVAADVRGDRGAEVFTDSVGIGCYRIDLHPATGLINYVDISSYPFQIPLGSLLHERMENLLPACKNLGVTHITNGCYRLHPVEWNIGEVAGLLAVYCLQNDMRPRQVRSSKLEDFQSLLRRHGIELDWPRIRPV